MWDEGYWCRHLGTTQLATALPHDFSSYVQLNSSFLPHWIMFSLESYIHTYDFLFHTLVAPWSTADLDWVLRASPGFLKVSQIQQIQNDPPAPHWVCFFPCAPQCDLWHYLTSEIIYMRKHMGVVNFSIFHSQPIGHQLLAMLPS